jgi:hypothetical protein
MSDFTVPSGRNPDEIHQTMTLKIVKFTFVYDAATTYQVPPSVIHTHWMQAVQAVLGNDIIIINNHNKPVETVSQSSGQIRPPIKNSLSSIRRTSVEMRSAI